MSGGGAETLGLWLSIWLLDGALWLAKIKSARQDHPKCVNVAPRCVQIKLYVLWLRSRPNGAISASDSIKIVAAKRLNVIYKEEGIAFLALALLSEPDKGLVISSKIIYIIFITF